MGKIDEVSALVPLSSARSLVASVSSFVKVAISAEPLNHGLLTANVTVCGLS
jgi:hypothetical protein